MKLSRLDIANFRCFESLSIPFRPDVNVLVGVNGAGKSAILDAIALSLFHVVAANGAGGLRQRKLQRAILRPSDIHVPSGSDFAHFRTSFTDYYEPETQRQMSLFSEEDWGKSTLILDQHIVYRSPNSFDYRLEGGKHFDAYFTALWHEAHRSPKALIPFPVVAYYRATRRISGMPEMGNIFALRLDRTSAFQGALDAGANYHSMCQWFYLRENQELREKQQRGRNEAFELPDLKAVRHALVKMLENVESVFFDDNPPTLKIQMASRDGKPTIMALEQLSDGYRNLLAVVLDFARRLALAHPHWEKPLEAPGILVIDEIDLHLHPNWQQRIITHLRAVFPNTQMIVATHSPAILTTVRREQILLLGADHQFESIPDDVGTYGAESSRVLAEVFGTHARPQEVPSVHELRNYLRLVEGRQHDSEDARTLRSRLESALGTGDPDLQRADLRIKQLAFLRQP
ncbi:MAG: AAA family ATPase [Magnetococcales bacterium]|nr:AAA family ATPase [Magnetococcales bacterium]